MVSIADARIRRELVSWSRLRAAETRERRREVLVEMAAGGGRAD
jgi:hypothetical protein